MLSCIGRSLRDRVVTDRRSIVERFPELFHPDAGSAGAWQTLPSAWGPEALAYPFMFVLPSGNVFRAGPEQTTRVLQINSWTWNSPITATYTNAGSAVMYRPGAVLRCGGYEPAADTKTDTIRFTGSGDLHNQWDRVADGAGEGLLLRRFHNLTVLPTGDVLVTGGLSGVGLATAQKRPQILKPGVAPVSWSSDLDLEPAARNYHSTAILLPDARVLSAGGELEPGGGPNPDRDNATIFEPPYLFNGNAYATRPVIASAPCRISFGAEFFIRTPDAASIAGGSVCLIRPGAVTHSFNQDQRYVPLGINEVCASGERLRVAAPVNGGIAPPGDYLLFIVNSAGVPSVAKWVRVGPDVPALCDATAPAQTTSFTVDIVGPTEAWTYWSAPGNDGSSGTAAEYDVRHSSQSPTEATFCNGTRTTMTPPEVAGSLEFLTVTGLWPSTQYYMALKTRDGAENWAPLSNVQQFTTTCSSCGGGFRAREVPAGLSLASGGREEAGPLQLSPGAGGGLAAEMAPGDGSPIWKLYYLGADEVAALAGNDSAHVVAQEPDGSGAWITHARGGPLGSSLMIRSGFRARRYVFLGDLRLEFAARKVAAKAAGLSQDMEVVSAYHSRLGNVKVAVDAADGYDLGLTPGDTLTLRYGPAARPSLDARDGFLWVSAAGIQSQAAGRRRPGDAPSTGLPAAFALHTNQPNPFAHLTTIRFALPRSEHVELEVFDILGRRIRTLVDGTFEAGEHAVRWDGRSALGVPMPAEIYHARIHAAEFRAQRTMVILPQGR